jgi:hypothetical protein
MLICINLRLVSNNLRVMYDSSYWYTYIVHVANITKRKHEIYHLILHCTSKMKTKLNDKCNNIRIFLSLFIHYIPEHLIVE